MTTKLSLAALGALGNNVAVPQYARTSLSPGILHFGVGNFHLRGGTAMQLNEKLRYTVMAIAIGEHFTGELDLLGDSFVSARYCFCVVSFSAM